MGIICGLAALWGVAFLGGRAGHLSSAADFAIFVAMVAVAMTVTIVWVRHGRTTGKDRTVVRAIYAPIAIPFLILLNVAHGLVDQIRWLDATNWQTGSDIFALTCAQMLVLGLFVLSGCASMLTRKSPE